MFPLATSPNGLMREIRHRTPCRNRLALRIGRCVDVTAYADANQVVAVTRPDRSCPAVAGSVTGFGTSLMKRFTGTEFPGAATVSHGRQRSGSTPR